MLPGAARAQQAARDGRIGLHADRLGRVRNARACNGLVVEHNNLAFARPLLLGAYANDTLARVLLMRTGLSSPDLP